jgi:hypothetical protein
MKQSLKLLVIAALIAIVGPAYAGTANGVYIDQIGSNSNLTVTQTGAGNQLGSDQAHATFDGNSQNISISQIGGSNIGVFTINGIGAVVNSTVTGSLNNVTVTCGTDSGSACTDTNITADVTGSSNTVTTNADSKSTISTTVTGDSNTVGIDSKTTNLLGARATVNVSGGNGNNVSVSQNGTAGASGFEADVAVVGASNTVGVTQSGTIDSTVKVTSTGSNNNITVTTGN